MNTNFSTIIRNAILLRIQNSENFTALDISNSLKSTYDTVRHRDVAEAVRQIFDAGTMEPFGYTRQLIEVVTNAGDVVHSYLYTHTPSQTEDFPCSSRSAGIVQNVSSCEDNREDGNIINQVEHKTSRYAA